MKPTAPWNRFGLFYLLAALWVLIFARDLVQSGRNVESIPYSQFLKYLQAGQISEVAIGSSHIEGALKSPTAGHSKDFTTLKVEDPDLTDRLMAQQVKFGALHESTFLRDLLSWVVPVIVMVGLWSLLLGRMGRGTGGGILSLGKSRAKVYVETDLKTRFEDVAGVDEAKDELKEMVNFLRDPRRYSKLGGRMPKGVLLVGAPGTGKTLLARAVAGEARVPFYSINGSEFVEMFVGLGAARVRDLFEQARVSAPCILFIDELDALGKSRGLTAITGQANDEKEQTLNQLLAEMDGFDPSRGIVVLAATNRPEVLDPALLRAGRFDRQILVDKPDRPGREQILRVHLRNVKLGADVNPSTLASLTAGFSGADLANLVNEAALIATRRGATDVQARDFTEAIERIVAGLERRSRLLAAPEKRRVAYHEMGHALVALAAPGAAGQEVHKVSIIPRGIAALGYTFRRPTEDRYLMSREDLEAQLAVALGGRAAEALFLSDISTGTADDLDKATEIARAMVTRYGMGRDLGLATFEKEPTPLLGSGLPVRSHEFSESTAEAIDSEIRRLLDGAFQNATRLLQLYRAFVEDGAKILLDRETLDEGELKALWSRHSRAALAKTA